jgi:predicted RNase H-like HicB family nuclease
MSEIIFLVEESPEGGFTAKCLTDSIFTQAETIDSLREMIKDAVRCHYENETKRIIRLHIVKEEVIAA